MFLTIAALHSATTSHFVVKRDLVNKQTYYTAVSGIEYVIAVLNETNTPVINQNIVDKINAMKNKDFPYPNSNYKLNLTIISTAAGSCILIQKEY